MRTLVSLLISCMLGCTPNLFAGQSLQPSNTSSTLGQWIQQQELPAQDGAVGDYFGSSTAIDGDTLIVGAPTHTVGANLQQGSVYVFVRSGSCWKLQQELVASDGAAGDAFGVSVSLSGDTAVV